MGDHGDRARVGCGDLRPPDVARPGTRRFLARGGELRVVLIKRNASEADSEVVYAATSVAELEPPSEPEPATLAPGGTGN